MPLDCRDVSTVSYDPATDSLAVRLACAVAAVRGVEPTRLPPLADVLDPEPLERLLASAATDPPAEVSVRFQYAGLVVRVTADRIFLLDCDAAGC
ncbi:HalOD1 output domain-containing protein [Salinirussus salinus]|jgi:hypothetical protein|uniref:HalOD1 output domain-containing protein n=1 Tax=Salinirussus salinus TaxID=1198300 RepID=UPI00135C61B2|nr:HalOD1 output domain-containing protein [Salinirussus salinus]